MSKILKFGVIPLIIILVLATLVFFLLYSFNINRSASEESQDIHFAIEQGEGVKNIAEKLKEKDLIYSEFWFNFYVWFRGKEKDFKPGGYILNTDNSIVDTVRTLTSERQADRTEEDEVTIKIPEGWNIERMGEYFEEQGLFSQEEWLDVVGHPRVDYREETEHPKPMNLAGDLEILENKPEHLSWEGYLFPDTYRVYEDSTPKEVAWKMIENLDGKITEKMRKDMEKQDLTIHEVLALASLLEEEVSESEDMKIVSGIFRTKLKRGEKLRSCASLAYILGENKPQYSTEDTQVKSDYNTYALKGLPPGPVSNPGLKAIRAAIYPKYTTYNFFLTRPDTKETVYAKTFSEHKKNKEKYLK